MAFTPTVLNPEPEQWFIKELALIDQDLRVVWGFDRYLMNNWVIEAHIPPHLYAQRYFSFLCSGGPRFIEQPIYDRSKPIYDEDGNEVGFPIIGTRQFDMAPEWEWRKTIQLSDGSFKPLGMDDILALKKEYAWNRNHAYSRAKFEAEQAEADAQKEQAEKEQRKEIWLEAYDQAWSETGRRVTGRPITATLTE